MVTNHAVVVATRADVAIHIVDSTTTADRQAVVVAVEANSQVATVVIPRTACGNRAAVVAGITTNISVHVVNGAATADRECVVARAIVADGHIARIVPCRATRNQRAVVAGRSGVTDEAIGAIHHTATLDGQRVE